MSDVAFNPDDPIQQQFLAALAKGESPTGSNPYQEGYGNVDLSNQPTDQYGFPAEASGVPSSAAGPFQFVQGTWDKVASQFNLNFSNPSDQEAGAWYNAQQTFQAATGGSLEEAATQAEAGNTSAATAIQNALRGQWPSVSGNAAAPQGLAQDLVQGIGANLGSGPATGQPNTGATSGSESANPSSTATGGSSGSILTDVEDFFIRFGLIIIGGLVILVALWQLLSDHTALPSPGATVKAAGEAIA